MRLTSGTKLGPYEIQSPLGAGGMGEVYRARDTRLERDVAIKILPPNLSSAPSVRQRFEREAKAVSKLAHPHICTLYDIGHHDGIDFLVMEFIHGETLEQRIAKGSLPTEQAVHIAAQLADGLARAHKLGIVHRDIKPSNVMLTKSEAKLMDFGLAKESVADPLSTTSAEPTLEKSKLTVEGMLVGTFQYMAPEQLEGKEADARTDIFALGAVIYEMLTGKAAFSGKSRASLIAAILSSEPPPISTLQPMTPSALDRLVNKCLAKDPDERWQSASDLSSELKWIAQSGSQAEAALPSIRSDNVWRRAAWPLATFFFVLAMVGGFAWWRVVHRVAAPMYFHAAVPFAANDLALSPDGRLLVMVAYSAQTNTFLLWTHEIGSRRVVALEGTQGASYPFWSPDSKFIAFFADGKLKKVDISGGQPQVLCEAPNGRGGAWNRDGVILFSPDSPAGLYRVAASGGTPVAVTKPDPARFQSSHRWPVFLPDGKHFLFLGANFSGRLTNNAVLLGSLDSQETRELVHSAANATYAPPGYLIYLRDRTLVAQRFDLSHARLSGDPFPLSDEVLYSPAVYRAVFSASDTGVLVMQTGKGASFAQLTWFNRAGKTLANLGPAAAYNNLSISPDGRMIAEDQTDTDGQNLDIWIVDALAGAPRRLTFDPALEQTPIWSPDGKKVLFIRVTGDGSALTLKNADGSGSEQQLSEVRPLAVPWDWSRDGKYILFKQNSELWYLSRQERTPKRLFEPQWTIRNAQFSPDGRWMAYASNETGSNEVYVTAFPSADSKWQISSSGGEEPRWRKDGKELFYLSPQGKMIAVTVKIGASFEAGSPVTLFQTHRRKPVSAQDSFSYDVSADGQKFLIITAAEEPNTTPPAVFLNWAAQMER